MRTEERIIEHAAYGRLLSEICHGLNVLDTAAPSASVDKLYVAGKRAALEEMRRIVRGWVRKIEEKEPKRITVELEFIGEGVEPAGVREPRPGSKPDELKYYEIECSASGRFRYVGLYNGARGVWRPTKKRAIEGGEQHKALIIALHVLHRLNPPIHLQIEPAPLLPDDESPNVVEGITD